MTVDLRTRYLGLELRSPIVASASPLNGNPVTARLVERAGAAAIVLPSLFEEEILAEEIDLNHALEQGTEHFAEGYASAFVADLLWPPYPQGDHGTTVRSPSLRRQQVAGGCQGT